MHATRWHVLGAWWIADLVLLLLLIPGNLNGGGLMIAVSLWLPPTAALALATWWRLHRHHKQSAWTTRGTGGHHP